MTKTGQFQMAPLGGPGFSTFLNAPVEPSRVRWERVPQSAKLGTLFDANTSENCHFSGHLLDRLLFSVSSQKCDQNCVSEHPFRFT